MAILDEIADEVFPVEAEKPNRQDVARSAGQAPAPASVLDSVADEVFEGKTPEEKPGVLSRAADAVTSAVTQAPVIGAVAQRLGFKATGPAVSPAAAAPPPSGLPQVKPPEAFKATRSSAAIPEPSATPTPPPVPVKIGPVPGLAPVVEEARQAPLLERVAGISPSRQVPPVAEPSAPSGMLGRAAAAAGIVDPEAAKRRAAEADFATTSVMRKPEGMSEERWQFRQALNTLNRTTAALPRAFTDRVTFGIVPAILDTFGLETPKTRAPQGQAEALATGAGELAGFIAGPAKAAHALMAGNVTKWLTPRAGDAVGVIMARNIATQAATLDVASGLAHLGEEAQADSLGEAYRQMGEHVKGGAMLGAAFGGLQGAIPSNALLPRAARLGVGLTVLDAVQGVQPLDDRALSQKAFDYGLNIFFLWKGQDARKIQAVLEAEAKARGKGATPEQVLKSVLDKAQERAAAKPGEDPAALEAELKDLFAQEVGDVATGTTATELRTAREVAEQKTGGPVPQREVDFELRVGPPPRPELIVPGGQQVVVPSGPVQILGPTGRPMEVPGPTVLPEAPSPLPTAQERAMARVGAPTTRRLAPVVFQGLQETGRGRPPLELWGLTEDIPGHDKGSTVGRETLEQAGFTVPSAPAGAQVGVRPTVTGKVTDRPASSLTFKDYVEASGKRWPVTSRDPDFARLRFEFDDLRKGLYEARPGTGGQWAIINRKTGEEVDHLQTGAKAQLEANRLNAVVTLDTFRGAQLPMPVRMELKPKTDLAAKPAPEPKVEGEAAAQQQAERAAIEGPKPSAEPPKEAPAPPAEAVAVAADRPHPEQKPGMELDTPEVVDLRARQEAVEPTDRYVEARPPARDRDWRRIIGKLRRKTYGNVPVRQEKKIWIVMGPPAAGKSSGIVNSLSHDRGAAILDSDAAKLELPESSRGRYNGKVHRESDAIMNRARVDAMEAGDNIVLPVVGKGYDTLRRYIDEAEASGYEVNLRLMHLPIMEAARRAVSRVTEQVRQGRDVQFVDPVYVVSIGEQARDNYVRLVMEGRAKSDGAWSNDVPFGEPPRRLTDAELGIDRSRIADTGVPEGRAGEGPLAPRPAEGVPGRVAGGLDRRLVQPPRGPEAEPSPAPAVARPEAAPPPAKPSKVVPAKEPALALEQELGDLFAIRGGADGPSGPPESRPAPPPLAKETREKLVQYGQMIFAESPARSYPDFARRITEKLGDRVRPYLPDVWGEVLRETARTQRTLPAGQPGGKPPVPPPVIPQSAKPIEPPPGLTEPQLKLGLHKDVVDTALDLFKAGKIERDPKTLISDQILDAIHNGTLRIEEMAKVLGERGMTFTEFGSQMFRPAITDAAKRLGALGQLQRRLNELERELGGSAGGEPGKGGPGGAERAAKLQTIGDILDAAKAIDPVSAGALSWWRRADGIRRGLMVTQLATAVRNFGSQVGRLGVDVLEQGLSGGLQRMFGHEVTAHPADSFRALMDVFSQFSPGRHKEMRARVDALLEGLPRGEDRLFNNYTSDLTRVAKDQKATTLIEKGLTAGEKATQMLNVFNRFQEYVVRRSVFQAELAARLRRRGIDIEDAIKSEPTRRSIPFEDIRGAIDKALEVTFANSPAYGSPGYHFIKTVNSMPGPTFLLPFPRFMVNSLKFLYEFSPLGATKIFSKAEQAKIRQGDMKTISRATIGLGMLGTAFLIRSMQDEDTKWNEIRLPGMERTMDVRPYNPFAAYLFVAEVLRRSANGTLYGGGLAGETIKNILGANVRGGTGLQTVDQLIDGLRDIGDTQALKRYMQGFGGNLVAGLLTPLQQLTDVYAQFDPESQILRSTREHPFTGPIKQRFPSTMVEALGGELPPERASATAEEPQRRESPGLRQIMGLTFGKEKNDFEKELDRLQFSYQDIMPRSGDPRLNNIIARHMGAEAEVGNRIVNSARYQRLGEIGKRLELKNYLQRLRKKAKARAMLDKEFREIAREVKAGTSKERLAEMAKEERAGLR